VNHFYNSFTQLHSELNCREGWNKIDELASNCSKFVAALLKNFNCTAKTYKLYKVVRQQISRKVRWQILHQPNCS